MTSVPSSERTGRTVAAVVLVLSALGAVVPFLATESVASSSPSGVVGAGSGGAGGGGDSVTSDSPRAATEAPGQDSDSGVVQNTPNGEPPPSDFPLPPGAKRHKDPYTDWVWASKMSAEDLYAFYRDSLDAAGWDWEVASPPEDPDEVGRGVSGPLVHRSDGQRYFFKIETGDFTENLDLVALFLNRES